MRSMRLLALLLLGPIAAVPQGPLAPVDPPQAGQGGSRSGSAAEPVRGEVVDPIACGSDAGQSYALYLPAACASDHPCPAVVVLDPRGRGRVAAELFRRGAERFGFIVLSSNNSLSDAPGDPNLAALKALAADLERYPVDPRRVYLAGFSGTSRFAWSVAADLGRGIAGVIGTGGALPGSSEGPKRLRFPVVPFFGAAGTADFNWAEMRALDPLLESVAVPHRIEFFDGPHSWPPAPLLEEALGWLEVQAMRDGRRAVDPALVDGMYGEGLGAARRLEEAGESYDALRRYRGLASDFAGLRDVAEAAAAARRLENDPRAPRQRQAIERAVLEEERYRTVVVAGAAERLRGDRGDRITPARLAADLKLSALERAAAADSEKGRSARRQLETALVNLSFYLPREFAERGEFDRAIACLTVAAEARPDQWPVWYNLAAALSRAGRRDEALTALGKAVRHGLDDAALIDRDPDFEPLRGDPRYGAVVQPLRDRPPAP